MMADNKITLYINKTFILYDDCLFACAIEKLKIKKYLYIIV